ncbi:MAG: MBL fold metallo-hydrolase [Thermoanaerobaculia bacterium]
MRGVAFTFDGLRIQGASRAGDQSWFRVDPPGLALDVGRGAEPLVGTPWIFVTHGHLDHSLGLPWVLTQRKLQGLGAATVFCPEQIAEDLTELVRTAGRLDGAELDAEVVGLLPGDRRELAKGLLLEVFATQHTASTLGCHLIGRQKKLKPELAGAPSAEIASLRRAGKEIALERETLWLSYCGDTGPEIFASEPRIFEAEILLIECTFMGAETRDHGRRFGHLHLEDFVENAERFTNRAIVLTHLSRRHRLAELEHAVSRDLPDLAERIRYIVGDRT